MAVKNLHLANDVQKEVQLEPLAGITPNGDLSQAADAVFSYGYEASRLTMCIVAQLFLGVKRMQIAY